MLTLSSMENFIVQCNLKGSWRDRHIVGFSLMISKIIDFGW